MEITDLRWQWVEDLKVYRIIYIVNNHYQHMTFIQERDMLDMPVPDAISSLLRMPLKCEPVEDKWR